MLKTLISVHLCIPRHSRLNFFSETRCLQWSPECTDHSTISLSWAQAPAHPKKLGTLREEAVKAITWWLLRNTALRAGIGRGREKDDSGDESWAEWLQTQLWKKHIIKRQKASQGMNVSACSVIAYNQIDVIIVRQHVPETAVIIRALTGSNTKPYNMAVPRSSSLSSCPTEKRGCAFISLY